MRAGDDAASVVVLKRAVALQPEEFAPRQPLGRLSCRQVTWPPASKI